MAARQFGRRRVGDEATVAQHDDAVGHQQRLLHVMRHHHAGQAERVVELAIARRQRVAGQRVERSERLVDEHQLRPCGERTRKPRALALAARQRGGQPSGDRLRQVDETQ